MDEVPFTVDIHLQNNGRYAAVRLTRRPITRIEIPIQFKGAHPNYGELYKHQRNFTLAFFSFCSLILHSIFRFHELPNTVQVSKLWVYFYSMPRANTTPIKMVDAQIPSPAEDQVMESTEGMQDSSDKATHPPSPAAERIKNGHLSLRDEHEADDFSGLFGSGSEDEVDEDAVDEYVTEFMLSNLG